MLSEYFFIIIIIFEYNTHLIVKVKYLLRLLTI